MTRFGLTNVSV